MGDSSSNTIKWFLAFVYLLKGMRASASIVIFVCLGENITITCPDNNVYRWQRLNSFDILASCENEMVDVNPNVSVTNDCKSLRIVHFSIKDVSAYRCYVRGKTKRQKHDIILKIKSLTIVEAKNLSLIKRNEGDTITLTCSLNEADPDTIIYWKTKDKILVSQRANSTIYRFITHRSDNKQHFICMVNDSKNGCIHDVSVQLNLILKPSVSVIVTPGPIVKQGQSIQLLCDSKYNEHTDMHSIMWRHNQRKLPNKTSILHFENAKPEISGEYRCTVSNTAGKNFDAINLTITYPPVLQDTNVTFRTNNEPRTLTCNALGVPNRYTFSKWQHHTYELKYIRDLNGDANGILRLPNRHVNDNPYEDGGIYTCNVTNGISDKADRLWQIGKIRAIVEGKPVFAKPLNQIIIGNFNETWNISLSILSSSNVTLFYSRRNPFNNQICYSSIVETEYFGQLFNVYGYKCDFTVRKTKDFKSKNYLFSIENEQGIKSINISVLAARKPEMPSNVQIIALNNKIIVKWRTGYNGGLQQTLFIEYKKHLEIEWESVMTESKTSITIKGLQMDTVYVVRMFSKTIVGESNKTGEIIVKTGNYSMVFDGSWKISIITGVTVVVFLGILSGIKGLTRRYCLTIASERSNEPQRNNTLVRHGALYDEVDSVYYIPATEISRTDPTVGNRPLDVMLSTSNNGRQFENSETGSFVNENSHDEFALRTIKPSRSSEHVSSASSSEESYLVPSRKYINLEVFGTGAQNEHEGEQENHIEGSSVSSSEGSETHIKTDQKYETLMTNRMVVHSYESIVDT